MSKTIFGDFTQYDEYEINGCIIIGTETDGTQIIEAVPCPEKNDRIDFWTVYGHISGEGVEAIADCATKEIAEEIAQLLREKYLN